MDSYNTDDTYNNDDFSPEGHDSHEIDVPSPENIHSSVGDIDEPSVHGVTSSADSLGINKVNVLTDSQDSHIQSHEVTGDGETTSFHNQLSKIMNPNGHALANESGTGYNESLSEIKDNNLMAQNHDAHNTPYQKADNSQIAFGCTGCATKCLHTCSGACFTSCSGSCDGSSSGR